MHTNLKSYSKLLKISKKYCDYIDYLAANGWERYGSTRSEYERDPYGKSYSAHKFYEKDGHINAVTVSLIPCRYFPLIQDVNLLAVNEYDAINVGAGHIDPDSNVRFASHEILRIDMDTVTATNFDKIISRYSRSHSKGKQIDLRPMATYDGDYCLNLSYNQYLGEDIFEYLTEDGLSIHMNLNNLEYKSYIRNDLFS